MWGMNSASPGRVCCHCGAWFLPDARNRNRQKACGKAECRRARKRQSQREWAAKNPDYFKEPKHAERVRRWRQRRKELKFAQLQREAISPQTPAFCPVPGPSSSTPGGSDGAQNPTVLQDSCPLIQDSIIHNPLILGLIGHIFRSFSEDDIANACRDLIARGDALLRTSQSLPNGRGGHGPPVERAP